MSILTKIAIVLVVVAALVVAPITINLATQPVNWRAAYQRSQERVAAVESTATQYIIATDVEQQQGTLVQQSLSNRLDAAQSRADRLEQERSNFEQLASDAQAKLDREQALKKDLQTTLSKEVEMRVEAQNQRAELAERLDRYQSENRELTLRIQDLDGQIARLEKQIQIKDEQLADRQDRIDELIQRIEDLRRRGLAGLGEEAPTAPAAAAEDIGKVTGEILAVRNNMASVNLGSNQGIEKGMKLTIYRGTEFVGYLEIRNVQAVESAGFVTLSKLDPQRGDKVTNRLAQ